MKPSSSRYSLARVSAKFCPERPARLELAAKAQSVPPKAPPSNCSVSRHRRRSQSTFSVQLNNLVRPSSSTFNSLLLSFGPSCRTLSFILMSLSTLGTYDPGSLLSAVEDTFRNSHSLTPRHSTIELKENTVIVVLGASGDLAKKKTFPALFGLVSHSPRTARNLRTTDLT